MTEYLLQFPVFASPEARALITESATILTTIANAATWTSNIAAPGVYNIYLPLVMR